MSFTYIPNKAEDNVTPCFVVGQKIHFLSSSRTPLFVSATYAVVYFGAVCGVVDDSLFVPVGFFNKNS